MNKNKLIVPANLWKDAIQPLLDNGEYTEAEIGAAFKAIMRIYWDNEKPEYTSDKVKTLVEDIIGPEVFKANNIGEKGITKADIETAEKIKNTYAAVYERARGKCELCADKGIDSKGTKITFNTKEDFNSCDPERAVLMCDKCYDFIKEFLYETTI